MVFQDSEMTDTDIEQVKIKVKTKTFKGDRVFQEYLDLYLIRYQLSTIT